jgi:hypothetical protein
MKIISVCLPIIFVFLVILNSPVLANTNYQFPKPTEGQVTEALTKTAPLRFLPSHPLYFFITIKETVNRMFQPSALKRAQFDLVLSGKRLKEAYLLLSKNDVKRASKSLNKYAKSMDNVTRQMEKARSQSQDVKPLVSEMAEDLRLYEILFCAIYNMRQTHEDAYDFDANFEEGINSFKKVITNTTNVEPGFKDRFRIIY